MKFTEVVVQSSYVFDLTVSEETTESMNLSASHTSPAVIHVEVAEQQYKQAQPFI